MAKIFVIGKITDSPKLKYSEKHVPYAGFTLMENVSGQGRSPQFYQVWVWYKNAEDLIKARADKGSIVQVTGSLMLEKYLKSDGVTEDKRLKVLADSWCFVFGKN